VDGKSQENCAGVPVIEQTFKFSLRDDLLAQLGGEITAEVDRLQPLQPNAWRVILKVNDSAHLEKTLSGLLEGTHTEAKREESGGVTTYSFRGPNGLPISYAFVDG
jgi:hypothetical protein